MTDRERFFDALPFYVNGTLDAAGRDWLRRHLAEHPPLRSQLQFMQALGQGVQEAVETSLQGVPADVGYPLLRERLAADSRTAQSLQSPQRAAASPWRQLQRWLNASAPQGWRLAQGLAMGLVLGFGAMLALQGERETPVGVRSTAPALAEGPLLRVNFTAAASETQLRFALIEARATIVAGPTRLGDYYLKPAPGQLAAARDSLSRSKVVQRIDEVPGLPPELTE